MSAYPTGVARSVGRGISIPYGRRFRRTWSGHMLMTGPMQRWHGRTLVDSEPQAGFPFRISFCVAGDCGWARSSLVAWVRSSIFLLPFSLILQPLHPVVVATRQLHIPLSVRQGVVSQPLLEHRRGDPVEDGVPPVDVPEGMGGPARGLAPPRRPLPSWTC